MSVNEESTQSKGNNGREARCELKNEYLKSMASDCLYHLGLQTTTHDLPKMFGDVRFVCIAGSAHRVKVFAEYIAKELADYIEIKDEIRDITEKAHRYSMYKVGPVLSVSHGIGIPSLSVMLDEILKLLHYAKCKDVTIIRIGTSGGIGVEPGTVVITNKAVDELLRPHYEQFILGKSVLRDAFIDQNIVGEIKLIADQEIKHFNVVTGGTMSANGFYESQGRLDGPICMYTEDDKKQFIQKLYDEGIRNIEMESVCLAAKCRLVNVKCATVCVTLVNRLEGDQVTIPPKLYAEMELRPQQLIALFIKRKLNS